MTTRSQIPISGHREHFFFLPVEKWAPKAVNPSLFSYGLCKSCSWECTFEQGSIRTLEIYNCLSKEILLKFPSCSVVPFFRIRKKSLQNPGWPQVHHHGVKMGFRKPRQPELVVARSRAGPVAGASVAATFRASVCRSYGVRSYWDIWTFSCVLIRTSNAR